MVVPLAKHLQTQGVKLHLADAAAAFERIHRAGDAKPRQEGPIRVRLQSGLELEADLVIMSVGVRPENRLAVEANLEVGPRGGIRVNRSMQTSDPDIYAVGDAVEVQHFVDGAGVQIALGGPANRQGRLAAQHLLGRSGHYRVTQGTSIVGLFGMAAAMTGYSEKMLVRAEIPHEKIYVHPGHHAGYYPGAQPISIKLLFCPQTGKVLGAQAVGWEGVDKRIDVLAMAIQAGMTAYDLEEAELAYAPQFGSAKAPANMTGFVAAGVLRGDQPIVHAAALLPMRNDPGTAAEPFVLDVRNADEFAEGHIEGAVNISIDQLRQRLDDVPCDRSVIVYCKVGMRGYLATRLLAQRGYQVANLSGGWTTYGHVAEAINFRPMARTAD